MCNRLQTIWSRQMACPVSAAGFGSWDPVQFSVMLMWIQKQAVEGGERTAVACIICRAELGLFPANFQQGDYPGLSLDMYVHILKCSQHPATKINPTNVPCLEPLRLRATKNKKNVRTQSIYVKCSTVWRVSLSFKRPCSWLMFRYRGKSTPLCVPWSSEYS